MRRLRLSAAALAVAGAIASPLAAAACRASEQCPLHASRAPAACHEAPDPAAPGQDDGADEPGCCAERDLAVAKERTPAPASPAPLGPVAALLPKRLPAAALRQGHSPYEPATARGAPLLALLCTLLI